jgi:hypothetical protein
VDGRQPLFDQKGAKPARGRQDEPPIAQPGKRLIERPLTLSLYPEPTSLRWRHWRVCGSGTLMSLMMPPRSSAPPRPRVRSRGVRVLAGGPSSRLSAAEGDRWKLTAVRGTVGRAPSGDGAAQLPSGASARGCLVSAAIQVVRTQGSRLMWISSSASTTVPRAARRSSAAGWPGSGRTRGRRSVR